MPIVVPNLNADLYRNQRDNTVPRQCCSTPPTPWLELHSWHGFNRFQLRQKNVSVKCLLSQKQSENVDEIL